MHMYMYMYVCICGCVCVSVCVCVCKQEKQDQQVLNLVVEARLMVAQQQQPMTTSYQRKLPPKASDTSSLRPHIH